jgi:hypothetical protein
VEKWKSGKPPSDKKVAYKAKIIAKIFAQFKIFSYLCNVVRSATKWALKPDRNFQ